MKKLLFILGAVGLCLIGCDSDDNDKDTQKTQNEQSSGQNDQGGSADKQDETKIDFTAICEFVHGASYDFSTLTAEQQTQLKKASVDSCVSYYDGLPACKSEQYAYFKCLYIDNTQCKDETCLVQACKEVQDKSLNCMDTNKDVYNKYEEQHDSEAEIEKLLQEWGLDIKDYYKDGEE